MKVRRILLALFLVSLMIVASVGTAKAESILFPYIASTTGALDTVITVIHASAQPQLHFRYFTKAAGVANEAVNPCNEYDFFRPTTMNDIVTFAVGGNAGLGGGNAMFGDTTNYGVGVGAPNFAHIHGSGRFGLLLVTTANANADVAAGNANTLLDGEASLYDIATGAMWGYRGLPSNADNAGAGVAATINSFAFATWTHASGSTFATLSEQIAVAANTPRLGIYPPNQFTTRLFVTPLVRTTGAAFAAADADMRTPNLNSTAAQIVDATGAAAMYDRNEQPVSGAGPLTVRCVGRLGIVDLVGGGIGPLAPTGPLFATGGWGYFDLTNPGAVAPAPALVAGVAATDHQAWVADLKFGNVTGMTGMVNDGKNMCDWGGCR